MLTTDTGVKIASRTLEIGGNDDSPRRHGQGAGMIGPNMATMLGVVITDAALTPDDAQAALKSAVDDSFNCISVEGHMSTNDTVLLLANGAAGEQPLAGQDLAAFQAALNELCIELAKRFPTTAKGPRT